MQQRPHKPAEAVHQIDEPQAEALRLADDCQESATHWVHEIDTRAKAAKLLRAQQARIAELEDDLKFVERWAVHHGCKPSVSAQETLSCIQHYPAIYEITKSYKDGKRPDTFNPYTRIAELESQLAAAPQEVQQGVQDNDSECREKVAKALGFDSLSSYAWSYLLKQIASLVGCEDELLELKRATHPTQQGFELHPNDVIRLAGEVGLNVYRGDGWPDEPLIAKMVKFAAKAKQGEQP